MKKLKIVLIFCVLISITNICYAAQSGIELKTTDELQSQNNFKVAINIDYSKVKEGVALLQGQLEYDEKIFKKLKKEDITLANGWSNLVFNEKNGMFIVEGTNKKAEGVQEIMYVNFTIKSVKKVEKTTVILKNIREFGESEKEKELSNAKLEVKISDNLAKTALPFAGINYLVAILIGGLVVIAVIAVIKVKKRNNDK